MKPFHLVVAQMPLILRQSGNIVMMTRQDFAKETDLAGQIRFIKRLGGKALYAIRVIPKATNPPRRFEPLKDCDTCRYYGHCVCMDDYLERERM